MMTKEVIVVNMFQQNNSKNAKTSNEYISTSLRSISMIQHAKRLFYYRNNDSSIYVLMDDAKGIGIS